MTRGEAKALWMYIQSNWTSYMVSSSDGLKAGYTSSDLRDTILAFGREEPTEGQTCENRCRPDHETMNAELTKELEYWKSEHCHLREEIIRLESILRTVEQFTGKNLLG